MFLYIFINFSLRSFNRYRTRKKFAKGLSSLSPAPSIDYNTLPRRARLQISKKIRQFKTSGRFFLARENCRAKKGLATSGQLSPVSVKAEKGVDFYRPQNWKKIVRLRVKFCPPTWLPPPPTMPPFPLQVLMSPY